MMLRQAGWALGARARRFTAQPCLAQKASASPVQSNLAAVLHGVKDLRFEEHPLPSTVQPGSMRIRMKAVGICGSDVHYLQEVWRYSIQQPLQVYTYPDHFAAGRQLMRK